MAANINDGTASLFQLKRIDDANGDGVLTYTTVTDTAVNLATDAALNAGAGSYITGKPVTVLGDHDLAQLKAINNATVGAITLGNLDVDLTGTAADLVVALAGFTTYTGDITFTDAPTIAQLAGVDAATGGTLAYTTVTDTAANLKANADLGATSFLKDGVAVRPTTELSLDQIQAIRGRYLEGAANVFEAASVVTLAGSVATLSALNNDALAGLKAAGVDGVNALDQMPAQEGDQGITFLEADAARLVAAGLTLAANDNVTPVAVNDAGMATEAAVPAAINATGNVLTNETDRLLSPARVVSAVRTGTEAGAGVAGAVGAAVVGQFGTLTLNADGTYTYVVNDANTQVNALNQNQTLQESFTYTINDGADGNLGVDTGELVITIQGRNDQPTVVAGAPSFDLVEAGGVLNGTAGTATAMIQLVKADADNTDAAAYDTTYLANSGWASADSGVTYTKDGTYGTATFTVATGVVGYALLNGINATENLKQGQVVTDSFALQVLDNNGEAAVAPVNATFTITGANDLPIVAGVPNNDLQEQGGIANRTAGTNQSLAQLFVVDPDGTASTFDTTGWTNVLNDDQPTAVWTKIGTYGYGKFSLNTVDKTVTFVLDNNDAKTEALAANAEVTDKVTVKLIDGDDNTKFSTQEFSFKIKGAADAPDSLASVTPDLVAASDSGTANNDDITNSTKPTVAVNLAGKELVAGDVIQLLDDATIVGSTTITALNVTNGITAYQVTVANDKALAGGPHNLKVRLMDSRGNLGPASDAALPILIDIMAPTSLATVTPDLLASSDSGVSDADNLTNDNTPTLAVDLTGKALSAGDVIQLVDASNGDAVVGSYTITQGDLNAPSKTLYEVTSAALADGNHNLKVRLKDLAGNLGEVSADAVLVRTDTVSPLVDISIADNELKAGEKTVVTFSFSEDVHDFSLGDVTAPNGNWGDLGAKVANGDGTFSFAATFTPASDVEDLVNAFVVGLGLADLSDNNPQANTASVNYAVDTLRPTATVTLDKNALKAGESSVVTIDFLQEVSGFVLADLTSVVTIDFLQEVSGFVLADLTSPSGALSNLQVDAQDPTKYTATFTPAVDLEDATNVITLDLTGVTDTSSTAAGVGTAVTVNYAVDTLRPTATVTLDKNALKAGESSVVTIDFLQEVSGFVLADLT
ncbi:MAG: Ig-like domain-containing protein [Cyanobacteria bacterium]|nr:Ig-like domain-containing protein [Cyanobacteriota bacterium]